MAGDMKQNLVIRPGDMIIAPRQEKQFINVTLAKEGLLLDEKPLSYEQLEKRVADVPQNERGRTVIALAVSAPDLPISRYFEVQARLIKLVKDYGLAYFSDVGIHPDNSDTRRAVIIPATTKPFSEPGAAAAPDPQSNAANDLTLDQIARMDATMAQYLNQAEQTQFDLDRLRLTYGANAPQVQKRQQDLHDQKQRLDDYAEEFRHQHAGTTRPAPAPADPQPPQRVGEYYISGHVNRTGVYSLTGREINLKQALASAGGPEADPELIPYTITVIRRNPDKTESTPIKDVSYRDLVNGKVKDLILQPYDIVQVNMHATGAAGRR
jgi:hypothetical protein